MGTANTILVVTRGGGRETDRLTDRRRQRDSKRVASPITDLFDHVHRLPLPRAAEGLDLPSLPTFSTSEEPYTLISAERELRKKKMKSKWERKKDRGRERETINSAAVQLYSYWLMGVMLLILFMEEQLLCSLPEPQPIISNNWWLGRHNFPPHDPRAVGTRRMASNAVMIDIIRLHKRLTWGQAGQLKWGHWFLIRTALNTS